MQFIAEKLKTLNFFYKRIASTFLTSMGVKFKVKRTVDELLFKGYVDNMIKLVNSLPDFLKRIDANTLPPDKFGWFYGVIILI